MLLALLACRAPTDDATGLPDSGETAPVVDTGESGDTGDSGLAEGLARLDAAAAADLAASSAGALSVAVWADGAILHTTTVGARTPGGTDTIGPDTTFQVGELAEILTTLTALRAAGADPTSALAAPLAATVYPSGAPPWADGITLDALLADTSGLYDVVEWHGGTGDDGLGAFVEGDLATREWTMVAPGTFVNPARVNATLAAAVAESLAGAPWPAQVDDLTDALGMSRTFPRLADALAAGDLALGVGIPAASLPTDPWSLADWANVAALTPLTEADLADAASDRPLGLLWSTPSDLARLGALLAHGDPTVLSDAARALVCADHGDRFPDLPHLQAGYGVDVDHALRVGGRWYPVTACSRRGSTPGYSSALVVLPESGFTVVVLASGFRVDLTATLDAALALAPLPDPYAGPDYPWDPTALDANTGAYRDRVYGDLVVTRDGDGLRIAADGAVGLGVLFNPTLAPLTTNTWTLVFNRSRYDLTFLGDTLRAPIFVGERL